MAQLIQSILNQVSLATILDVGITAVLIYWLFSLIRGTSAVRLVIGVSVLFAVYFVARFLQLRLLIQILETGAVVGLFALVVVFQPELRRALDRIGRVGSFGWLLSAEARAADLTAREVSRAAAVLSAEGHGALMVIERETGLEQVAETGVMIHGDLSADLLRTIFSPKSPLHDGAVIVRGSRIVAAGAMLPLSETTIQSERFGTRHRAALGTTEQTDAIVVVVSEENGQMSLVQRARIRRNLNETQLSRALRELLEAPSNGPRLRIPASVAGAGTPGIAAIGRAVRTSRRARMAVVEPMPPDEPMSPQPRTLEPTTPEPATHEAMTSGPASSNGRPSKAGTPDSEPRAEEPASAGTGGRKA
jgi:diadenylate cyclase